MNKITFIIALFLVLEIKAVFCAGQTSIIPEPLFSKKESGKNIEVKTIFLEASPAFDKVGKYIKNELETQHHIPVTTQKATAKSVRLNLVFSSDIENAEGYELSVKKREINITASSGNGIFYGFQSLRQLLTPVFSNTGTYSLVPCVIKDEPRYGWRGFMLDESRHFFGKKKVKQILDLMALNKLNTFHWHLTDEPGWRIEIKAYPELTRTGAIGNYTNPEAAPAFYTQKDIEDIVHYAAERFIQVVPEIDMPGHASAAVRSYPYLSGGGTKEHPDFTFNPGKEEVYQFLTNVLDEVSSLFPAPYIHIGGDEVHFGNQKWSTDPAILQLMEKHDLKNTREVEHYFIKRMNDTIQYFDKRMIGWDEIVESGVSPKSSVVMWWRHDKPQVLEEALEKGYPVILCPRIPLYFDFVQQESDTNGRKWGGRYCSSDSVYVFPDNLPVDVNQKDILGIQANLWSERFASLEAVDYMMWPRLSALAEAAWSASSKKDFDHFLGKMKNMYQIYDQYNVYYFDLFSPLYHPEPKVLQKH